MACLYSRNQGDSSEHCFILSTLDKLVGLRVAHLRELGGTYQVISHPLLSHRSIFFSFGVELGQLPLFSAHYQEPLTQAVPYLLLLRVASFLLQKRECGESAGSSPSWGSG